MTLPNKLTLARIILLPISMVLLYSSSVAIFSLGFFLAFFLGVTDFIDGYLARRLKQVSNLGKFLDPIADKLFVLLAALLFVNIGLLPAWFVILLMAREFVISDFRLLALGQGREVAVSQGGKWKAACQYFLLATVGVLRLIDLSAALPQWLLNFRQGELMVAYWILLTVTIVLTVSSMAEYFWSNRALLRFEANLEPSA